jgi:GT2 family glycosyltransferase
MTIAVLLTAHNRPKELWQCLDCLKSQKNPQHLQLYLTLDNCQPKTAQMRDKAQEKWPTSKILTSKKDLYWTGGTNLAWREALKNPNIDAYLLLNQDAYLFPNGLTTLIQYYEKYGQKALVAGRFLDPQTKKISYGGWEFDPNPLKLATFKPNSLKTSMANANALLVGREIQKKVGILDPRLPHRFADFDYTLRAEKLRIPTILPETPIGECERNKPSSTPQPTQKTWKHRLFHPKEYHLPSKWLFLWKHKKEKIPAQTTKTLLRAIFPNFCRKIREKSQHDNPIPS